MSGKRKARPPFRSTLSVIPSFLNEFLPHYRRNLGRNRRTMRCTPGQQHLWTYGVHISLNANEAARPDSAEFNVAVRRAVPESEARRPAPARHPQFPTRQSAATPPLNQPRPPTQPSTAAPGEEDNAIHPPIDWANELNRAARESSSAAAAPQPREFGAPHTAPVPAKPPEFGWSHSRTHRVETGPGGLAIHFGDNCVIAFTPVPFPICTVGRKEANGELFKHMRDPPQPGDWKDLP